jgi:hypothetical protein
MGLLFYQSYAIIQLKVNKNKYMNSEQAPTNEVYVPYNGSVAKWELSNETDAAGNQIAQGPVEKSEDGTLTRMTKSLRKGALGVEVQESLRDKYAEIQRDLGYDALKSDGVIKPEIERTDYDRMLDPNDETPRTSEGAAVRPVETEDDRMSRERTAADANNAALLYAAQRKSGIR